jgi:hypothetical protein
MERPKRPDDTDFFISLRSDPELNDYVEALEAYCKWADGEIESLRDQLAYEMFDGNGC